MKLEDFSDYTRELLKTFFTITRDVFFPNIVDGTLLMYCPLQSRPASVSQLSAANKKTKQKMDKNDKKVFFRWSSESEFMNTLGKKASDGRFVNT